MIDRVGFAYQYQNWDSENWSEVVFSDEKAFCSDAVGSVWVHRPRGKRFEEKYVYPQRKSGRFSVGKFWKLRYLYNNNYKKKTNSS